MHTRSTLGKASLGSRSRDGAVDLASASRFFVGSLNERAASLFLALLLCGDVAFVAGHLINGLTPLLDNDPVGGLDYRLLLNLETDRGYGEVYQYLKFIWIAVLFLSLSMEKSDLALLVAGLVFFGVGIDMAHAALDFMPGLGFSFGVVEDGGEMLMTTLLLWYVILTKLRGESADAYLSDFLRSVACRRQPRTY